MIESARKRSKDILTDQESIIFKQFDVDDLMDKLLFVYNNQSILSQLRENVFKRKDDFSITKFEVFLEGILKQ